MGNTIDKTRVIPLVPGKNKVSLSQSTGKSKQPLSFAHRLQVLRLQPGTLRSCTILPLKKLGPINSPFFPFSILQAIKVEICHTKGSVRDNFPGSKKPISLKKLQKFDIAKK